MARAVRRARTRRDRPRGRSWSRTAAVAQPSASVVRAAANTGLTNLAAALAGGRTRCSRNSAGFAAALGLGIADERPVPVDAAVGVLLARKVEGRAGLAALAELHPGVCGNCDAWPPVAALTAVRAGLVLRATLLVPAAAPEALALAAVLGRLAAAPELDANAFGALSRDADVGAALEGVEAGRSGLRALRSAAKAVLAIVVAALRVGSARRALREAAGPVLSAGPHSVQEAATLLRARALRRLSPADGSNVEAAPRCAALLEAGLVADGAQPVATLRSRRRIESRTEPVAAIFDLVAALEELTEFFGRVAVAIDAE
jgi:hypothetical protein